jgi:hypothetical protein
VTVDPADVEVPELPERVIRDRQTGEVTVGEWHPAAVATWHEVWTSPMATAGEFIPADYGGLRMLLALEHDFWTRLERGGSVTKLAAEVATIRKSYGLAPMGRRSLQWTIASTQEATGRTRGRRRHTARRLSPEPSDDVAALLDVLDS